MEKNEMGQKAADINLRNNDDRFRLLVESVQDYAILMLDPAGRVASWNLGAEYINGYRAGEIIGAHFSRFYPPEDIANGKPAFELVQAQQVGRFEDEGWRLRKDGGRFWANVVITALRDKDGTLRGYGKVVRDMTERKRAQEQISGLNTELEQRVNELESFSYSVSHDLRAPLRAISGFSEILARRHRGSLNEEGRHFIDNIVEASAHMGRMIDDLLRYSRLGRTAVELQRVALNDVLAEVCKDLAARIAETGATLELAGELPSVYGNRMLLSQVFANLLDNALTYHKSDTPVVIKVQCRADADRIIVSVHDNGIGIPVEYFEKIFTVFQRLHSQDEYPGTGIGLAIVKRSVMLMNGQLWVDSEPGKGSAFYVSLPGNQSGYDH